MRLVNQRLLARALLQCFLGTVFFCLGVLYHQSQNCSLRAQMHPDHYGNPELVDAWNDGLKHKETFLLIVILSSPQNEERRNVIRETWANVAKQHRENFLLYFSLGSFEISDDRIDAINAEKSTYKDILSLPMVDNYSSLTSKILSTFVHLNRNVKFSYLLKVDDDSYVQLPQVLEELKHSNFPEKLYWGFFDGRAPVWDKGKWAESEYRLCDKYLPYALGGGYVLSKVRKKLLYLMIKLVIGALRMY